MTTTPRGISLLRDPRVNKSTAFTEAEREALGLVCAVFHAFPAMVLNRRSPRSWHSKYSNPLFGPRERSLIGR
jgi:hypothetical protein